MNVPFSGSAARAALRSAHAALDGLTVSIGNSGGAAMAVTPGLVAVVDQHAAAVRDSLSADERALTAVMLAAYAEGVCDAADRHGWQPPAGEIDWSGDDWVLRRLLAVCRLARELPGA
jgi:hypothetical protein